VEITTHQKDWIIDVLEESSPVLLCSSNSSVRWYFQSLQADLIHHSSTLKLNVTFKHAGLYLCFGKSLENDTPFISQILLRIFGEFDFEYCFL